MPTPAVGTPRALGASGITVTAVGLGCAPLGNLYAVVTDDEARSTIDAAWAAGMRLFDTAPLYGSGLSEQRTGAGLADRPDAVVASKAGRLLDPSRPPDPLFVDVPHAGAVFDLTESGVRRSVDESRRRLGRDRLDVCWLHDVYDFEVEAATVALPALHRLRAEGAVGAVGVGMNEPEIPARFVRAGLLDAVLIAGKWHLLDQSAGTELLPLCAERNVGVVVGGVFASGLLADPWRPDATYFYATAPAPLVERARKIADVCEQAGTSLLAAALQFPFLHDAVTAIVIGARSAAEVEANVAAFDSRVPDDLWPSLVAQGLLPEEVLAR
jgi:D-threo-aldose 1-dehydrogenase